ncbi:hypothetical protein [Anatilimnocola floriformis]|uniref:hypothetical protein n=1 Tax=Anatilimnocola floriformis TaxID=2948575 RepID=UPI0020C508D4|nr:hypothetical protein [Anatilimnocola floriformis]
MKLVFNHRWEHALLAAVISEAKEKCPGCFLGRTAIQKILYFLNVLGVPMRYDFDIYHYGPFCSSIMADVDWLIADNVITDGSSQGKYSDYRPGPASEELLDKFDSKISEHLPTIQNVVEALGEMSPGDLELIATLDFCYRWVSARGGKGPWKAETVKKFKSIKKDKFTNEEIDHWYGQLVNAELIKP